MSSVAYMENYEDCRRERAWWERIGGTVLYFDPDERMEDAARDEYLQAFCELKTIGMTEVDLPEQVIDALEEYSHDTMMDDLRARYLLSRSTAAWLIEEVRAGITEEERVRALPHGY